MIYRILSINTLPLATEATRQDLHRELAERKACVWHEPGTTGFLSSSFWHHQVVALDPDSGRMETLGEIDPRCHDHVDQINADVQAMIERHRSATG